MSRRAQEDLIFVEKKIHCDACNVDNAYFVIVKPFGQVVLDGTLCPHVEKNRIGKEIKKYEAAHFLRAEKREAEKIIQTNGEVNGEKREAVLQFISNVNNALGRMKMQAY